MYISQSRHLWSGQDAFRDERSDGKFTFERELRYVGLTVFGIIESAPGSAFSLVATSH